MGDLIERDKIYEAVYDLACKSVGVIGGISEDYAYGLREAAHMIEEAPAVDAVPVVRCKHCVYGEPCKWPVESDRYYCTHPQSAFYDRGKTQCPFVLSHEKNHYCEFGKQRENAE